MTNDRPERRTEDLLPPAIARRVVSCLPFVEHVARYRAMDDTELLRVVEVCLRNLERIDDGAAGADVDLRIVLVPELCERVTPGTRDRLRRLSSTLAEYDPDPGRPSIFALRIPPDRLRRLREDAEDLRRRITETAALGVSSLVEQTRFSIAGSRAAERWAPTDCVYEPAFAYRLVPVVALRALERGATNVPR